MHFFLDINKRSLKKKKRRNAKVTSGHGNKHWKGFISIVAIVTSVEGLNQHYVDMVTSIKSQSALCCHSNQR